MESAASLPTLPFTYLHFSDRRFEFLIGIGVGVGNQAGFFDQIKRIAAYVFSVVPVALPFVIRII